MPSCVHRLSRACGTPQEQGQRHSTSASVLWADGSSRLEFKARGSGEPQFDIFISHAHRSGQDQARILKMQFERLLPRREFFLDLDMVDVGLIANLEEHVHNSSAFLVLLTVSRGEDGEMVSDYFSSPNCWRELRAAVSRNKPIILVNDSRGASLDVHSNACELVDADVHSLLFHGCPVVDWYREPAFMLVSLKLILQHVLITENMSRWCPHMQSRYLQSLHRPPGAVGSSIYISTELSLRVIQVPKLQVRHHLFVCAQNRGVHGLVARLSEEASLSSSAAKPFTLLTTTEVDDLDECAHVLFFLRKDTFGGGSFGRGGSHANPPARHLADAQTMAPMQLLIELTLSKGCHISVAHDGNVHFDDILAATPAGIRESLLTQYMSTPVMSGPYEKTSLRLLLMQIAHSASIAEPKHHANVRERAGSLTRGLTGWLARARRRSYINQVVTANGAGEDAGRIDARCSSICESMRVQPPGSASAAAAGTAGRQGASSGDAAHAEDHSCSTASQGSITVGSGRLFSAQLGGPLHVPDLNVIGAKPKSELAVVGRAVVSALASGRSSVASSLVSAISSMTVTQPYAGSSQTSDKRLLHASFPCADESSARALAWTDTIFFQPFFQAVIARIKCVALGVANVANCIERLSHATAAPGTQCEEPGPASTATVERGTARMAAEPLR